MWGASGTQVPGKVPLPSSLSATEAQTIGTWPEIIHSAVMTPWPVGCGKNVHVDIMHSGDQIGGGSPLNNYKVHHSLWEPLFLYLLKGRSHQVRRHQTKDSSVNSRLQSMPRMQCGQRAHSPLSAWPREEGGASSSLEGPCQASWKPWHKTIRCRPHYVSKKSCLNPGQV